MKRTRVCLIATGALSTCPRLIKHATALVEYGADVRIVSIHVPGQWSEHDRAIVDNAQFRCDVLPLTLTKRFTGRITRWGCGVAYSALGLRSPEFIALSQFPLTGAMAGLAARESANLFMGHGAHSLAPAVRAAELCGTAAGYDAEDFHPGEVDAALGASPASRKRLLLDRSFLPRCALRIAGSPAIAQAYEDTCGVSLTPILNVFPLSDAPSSPRLRPRSPADPLKAYWFSQTVGLDRGLQGFILAMGRTRHCIELTIRGSVSDVVRASLNALASSANVASRVTFLPVSPPGEMVEQCSRFDVGLSLEPPSANMNKDLCLGNKLFTYLLAGTPVLLSRTTAQVAIASQLGTAAQVVDGEDPKSIAAAIDRWAFDNVALEDARRSAWQLGQDRYNWDVEKRRFLAEFERAMVTRGRS